MPAPPRASDERQLPPGAGGTRKDRPPEPEGERGPDTLTSDSGPPHLQRIIPQGLGLGLRRLPRQPRDATQCVSGRHLCWHPREAVEGRPLGPAQAPALGSGTGPPQSPPRALPPPHEPRRSPGCSFCGGRSSRRAAWPAGGGNPEGFSEEGVGLGGFEAEEGRVSGGPAGSTRCPGRGGLQDLGRGGPPAPGPWDPPRASFFVKENRLQGGQARACVSNPGSEPSRLHQTTSTLGGFEK
ncbi:basic salivary proline-rich protein 4 [Lynx canadensis]|uniref:basic salivary proline-rich protein 4 n=1 Tax=Lynx canadensis TaxID=61383 RepID=UPI0011B08BC9|nr:basic salivary proline-rich protein 4 [Lynx canadensis]